jgi:hypothetical protein
MEVLNILQDYGILNIAVIIATIGLISKLRSQFLDVLLDKIKKAWLRWIILTVIALALSFGFTALNFIAKFSIQEYLRQSFLNWCFAWVFHDTIKNLFFKKENDAKDN